LRNVPGDVIGALNQFCPFDRRKSLTANSYTTIGMSQSLGVEIEVFSVFLKKFISEMVEKESDCHADV
jgi:hypothetical protein